MATQSGIYHDTYESDMQLRPTTAQRVRLVLVVAVVLLLPLIVGQNEVRIINKVMIAAIGAIGLNILVGYTGQISLGQGAFLAVGAYAGGLLMVYFQVPWGLALLLAACITALVGAIFGLPSLRLKGLYLAVATLAAQQIVEWIIIRWDPIDGVVDGKATDALKIPNALLFNNEAWRLNDNEYAFYYFVFALLVVVVLASVNLFRTHYGRAFIAIRDQDIAAEVMGVNLFSYKLLAFAISSFLVGLAGGLTALHSTAISFERFTIDVSIAYLAMIIVGGLGSISGAIYGAIFIEVLPELLRAIGQLLVQNNLVSDQVFITVLPFVQQGAFGFLIVLMLIVEPEGIRKLWSDVKDYFRLWPFSY